MTTGDVYYFCSICGYLYNMSGCPTHGNQSPQDTFKLTYCNSEEMQKDIESKFSLEQIKQQIEASIRADYSDFKMARASTAREMRKYNEMIDKKWNNN